MKVSKVIKYTLYWLVQCTWGILQTLLGLVFFLRYAHCKHEFYGAYLSRRQLGRSFARFVYFCKRKSPGNLDEGRTRSRVRTHDSIAYIGTFLYVCRRHSVNDLVQYEISARKENERRDELLRFVLRKSRKHARRMGNKRRKAQTRKYGRGTAQTRNYYGLKFGRKYKRNLCNVRTKNTDVNGQKCGRNNGQNGQINGRKHAAKGQK